MQNISFEQGVFLNLLSVILTACAMTISKFALVGADPVLTTLAITTFSTLISLSYILYKKCGFSLDDFKKIAPIAALNALATIFLYWSIAILNPVVVGMIGRFYVVFTTILSVLILKEKIDRTEFFFILTVIIGTFFFVKKDGTNVPLHYIGIAMGLSYTFLFALANLFVKKSIHNVSSVTILFYNNLFAAIACSLLLIAKPKVLEQVVLYPSHSWLFAFATALITFLGLVVFFNSFRFVSFRLSNLIRSTSPIFVAVVSLPFFPLTLSSTNIMGGTILLGSVLALTLKERKNHKKITTQ